MAALHLPALFLCLSIASLLISPSHSQACNSPNFTNSERYTNCIDLPTLNTYLHWTYDTTKSSLSIAFLAIPPVSSAWIAWGINPAGQKMIGTQALIAFKQFDGAMTINTYDVNSYQGVLRSKISFEVSDVSAEYSQGLMMIFATLALPANTMSVNHVWQIGKSVDTGVPQQHDMAPANLHSVGMLELVKSEPQGNGPQISGSGTPSPLTPNSVDGKHSGSDRFGSIGLGFFVSLFIAILVFRGKFL